VDKEGWERFLKIRPDSVEGDAEDLGELIRAVLLEDPHQGL
jgi:hypothetical protein